MLNFLEDELFKANFRPTDETLERVKYSRIALDVKGNPVERIAILERNSKTVEVSDWRLEDDVFLTGERYHLRSRPEIQTAILAITA